MPPLDALKISGEKVSVAVREASIKGFLFGRVESTLGLRTDLDINLIVHRVEYGIGNYTYL